MLSILWSKWSKLNLFEPKDGSIETEHQRYSNRIATRIYLVVLFIILIFISEFFWLRQTKQTIEIKSPSRDQFEKCPETAQCPCSQLAFSYGTFIKLDTIFHPICSSQFIEDRWIRTLFYLNSRDNQQELFYKSDFRQIGSQHFRSLAFLCQQLSKTIEQNLNSFYSTSFISSNVLNRIYLQSIIEASIERFQLTLPFVFQSQLQLINEMIFSNQLIPSEQTTLFFNHRSVPAENGPLYPQYWSYLSTNKTTICRCDLNPNCHEPLGFYSTNMFYSDDDVLMSPTLLFAIPNLRSGCTTIKSLLQSTLECFYDQICLDTIRRYSSIQDNFTSMIRPNDESRFQIDSTIESLIDHLMIQQWTKNFSYENYFDQCRPSTCIYSIMKKGKWNFIVTKIIGLLGGLTMILQFLIPFLVRFLRERKLSTNQTNLTFFVRIRRIIDLTRQRLINLNLFDNQSANVHHIVYQRLATRLYFLVLFVTFIIFIFYSLIKDEIYQGIIIYPNESQYIDLKETYLTVDIHCPCKYLSISHEKFLRIDPVYHPICSSLFITREWIRLMSMSRILSDDDIGYRANPGTYFSVLSTFCHYAQQMVQQSIELFLQTQFVSSQLIEQRLFYVKIRSLIDEFQLNTINNFHRTIELIREMTRGNQLINDLFNVYFMLNETTNEIYFDSLTYSNCSCHFCGSSTTNLARCALISSYRLLQLFSVPEFFIGCYPVESLLKSKMICFYNETCFQEIFRRLTDPDEYRSMYNKSHVMNSSISQPNETMEMIVNRLMIDKWNWTISFDFYFNSCRPLSCQYEYKIRSHGFILILNLITFIGGLSTGLKIFLLCFLRIVENLTSNHRHDKIRLLIQFTFIFDSNQKSIDRLHFLIMLIILLIISMINLINVEQVTNEVLKPSFSLYKILAEKYSSTLRCFCTNLSFKSRTFLTFDPTFHPICSSEFMSNQWLIHNNEKNSSIQRRILFSQYQLLISLCQLVQKTVNDGLLQFYSIDHIDVQLKSELILNKEMKLFVNDYQLRMSQTFVNILNLLRGIISMNMLMNLYSSNAKYQSIPLSNFTSYTHTQPMIYDECNCGISSNCHEKTFGMEIGCYPFEGLVQSTFQCFYDQQCIDPTETFHSLNSSFHSTRFHFNETIESIIQELMVEEYRMNLSFYLYYQQCCPSSCQYSYSTYGQTIDIIILLIGLYGGLIIVSRCLAVLIWKMNQWRKREKIDVSSTQ